MKPNNYRSKVLPCVAAMLLASCATQSAKGSRPEVVAHRFVAAWNAHSPSIFTVAVDSDATWVNARGEKLRGRNAIKAYLALEHSTWAKETKMSQLDVEPRSLCEDVSIVALSWQIARTNGEAFRGMTHFVAKKEASGWVVTSGQVTSGRSQQ